MGHILYSFFDYIFLISYVIIKCYWAQLLVLGIIIAFIIFLIKNIKRKRKKQIAIFSSLIIAIVLLIISFYIIFPTHFPYVDMWIYGKTREEIQEVYGEPDCVGHGIFYDIGFFFGETIYYRIKFDINGRAIKISETTTTEP